MGQSAVVAAIAALTVTFATHATFFSTQTNQAAPLDPQVFIKDAAVQAGSGPQDIGHSAGFRPALLADPPDAPLFNAQGAPLGFTLTQWLGARGNATVSPVGINADTITIVLQNLIPYAAYSLFDERFDQQPPAFVPLDGSGTGNSFVAGAGGDATVSLTVSPALTHADSIVVVYHSDGQPHGVSRGAIGITAHDQLIVRIP